MAGQQRYSVEWENTAEVEKALARALEKVDQGTTRVTRAVAADAKRRAQELVPVDTGRLKRSISMQTDAGRTLVVGVISANMPYARYVEFGTSQMRAQPYLRPAMLEAQTAWDRQAKQASW